MQMLFTIFLAICLSGITSLTRDADRSGYLTIASWNIAWFGDGVNDCVLRGNHKNNESECHYAHVRDKQHYQRLSQYAAMLNADVVALQEVENIVAIRQVFAQSAWQVFISSRQTSPKWAQHTAVVVHTGLKVKRHADYVALDTSSGHLRYGVDLTITPPVGIPFRMLAIHLKSGCFNNMSGNVRVCKSLHRQKEPLENWIDAQAESRMPFIVVGDWNRHIAVSGDQFWQELNDAEPDALRLQFTAQGHSLCHSKARPFVDHIVLGGLAVDWFKQFRELVYTESGTMRKKISDHCPITVTLAPHP